MITLDFGKLGSGKSASATWEVWKTILQGRDCYVNWKIDFTKYFEHKLKSPWWRLWNPTKALGKIYYFDKLKDLEGISDGEIFYDEASIDLDARDYKNTPKEFRRKLAQSRKYHLNLHFIVQYPGQIDNTVRNLCNTFVVHKKFMKVFFWKEYDGEALEAYQNMDPLKTQPKSIGTGFNILGKRFLDSYNTFALFHEFEPFIGKVIWDPKIVLDQRKAQKKARQVIPVEPTASVPLENLNQKGGD